MGTTITGAGITLFQLLSWKGLVKLHSQGIKNPKALRAIKQNLNLEPRTKLNVVLAELERRINTAAANIKPGDIVSWGESE